MASLRASRNAIILDIDRIYSDAKVLHGGDINKRCLNNIWGIPITKNPAVAGLIFSGVIGLFCWFHSQDACGLSADDQPMKIGFRILDIEAIGFSISKSIIDFYFRRLDLTLWSFDA